MAAAGDVQHVGGAEEPVHRLGDEAAVPGAAGGIDARLARVADGLAADAFVGGGERRAGEQAFRRGDLAAGQEHRGRRLPLRLEQHAHALDGGADARHDVDAVLRIADREGEHVGELPGAPVAQQQAPRIERAGHHRGQHAGRRDQVDVELAEFRQRRGLRCDALAADHLLRLGARRMQDDRRIAAGAVEMRLRHLQRERRRGGGVERIAAALQHRHADLARDPVRAGDDTERAGDLRAGGEHARFSVAWRAG